MATQINTFSGGMKQDIDPHIQEPSTYRFSSAGSIIYNTGIDSDGSSFSYCNEEGNTLAFSVCDGYDIVSTIRTEMGLIVLSTNGIYSHIGLYKEGLYTTLFNDRFDPNGDRLHFRKTDEGRTFTSYIFENNFKQTVYLSDGYNQDRAIDLALFFDGYSCESSCDKSIGMPLHIGGCLSVQEYPNYLSVHGMQSRMDVIFPDQRFVQTIDGRLKRGAYQYAMRYVSASGHKSLWSPIDRHILVTGTHLQPYSVENHHHITMSSTDNDSITKEGIRIELLGLDRRWAGIEVAYIYSKTDKVSHEATLFYTNTFDCGKERLPINLSIDHVEHGGVPISFDEFNQRYETILSSKTAIEEDNKIYFGGIEFLDELSISKESVSFRAFTRDIVADETLEPEFISQENEGSRRLNGDPLTNSSVKNESIFISKFGLVKKELPIINDRINYKGIQVEHSLQGYFRMETYPFAVVIFDRKGNPLFAHHLKDFTFPSQFDESGNFTLTKQEEYTGIFDPGFAIPEVYNLRIMGVIVDGIKIPKKCLRDRFGKLNIGGFSIVRGDRIGGLLHQGIVTPVMDAPIGGNNSFQQGVQAKPYPLLNNKFQTEYSKSRGASHLDSVDNRIVREEDNDKDDENEDDDSKTRGMSSIEIIAKYAMYYSPDCMIEEIHTYNDRDYLRHVGTAHKAYSKNNIPLFGSDQPFYYNNHFYTKSYNTEIDRVNGLPDLYKKYGRSVIGEDSRLKFSHYITDYYTRIESFDKDATEIVFKNGIIDTFVKLQNTVSGATWKRGKCAGVSGSLLLGMDDFEHIDIHDEYSTSSYRIMNYMRPTGDYFTSDGDNSLDARKYFNIGHFQPISEDILFLAESDDDSYIFNNIELWGGDCFLNLFDFAKSVPYGTRDCHNRFVLGDNAGFFNGKGYLIDWKDKGNDLFYPELASSIIVPIESKYNIALRYGRNFAANATYPQIAYCENRQDLAHFSNGIMTLQPESFSINRVLLHKENIQFYAAKPQGLKVVSEKKNAIYVSDEKLYNELEDSYRKVRVNNYTEIHGEHGAIVAFVKAFNYIYVIQERAYGILRARERAIVATNVGEVLLGTGKDLDGVDYISTEHGTVFAHSVVSYNGGIYFWDNESSVIVRHSQGGRSALSDEKAMHSYIYNKTNFESISNVITGVDRDNGDVYFSIYGEKPTTLVFNSNLNIFHGFMPYIVPHYFSISDRMYAVDTINKSKAYLQKSGYYGHFFGKFYDTIVKFIVNMNFNNSKVFDTMGINVNKDGNSMVKTVKIKTQHDEHTINLYSDNRAKYREDMLLFPTRELKSNGRLRDHLATVELTIDNAKQMILGKQQVIITAIKTNFRISNRT